MQLNSNPALNELLQRFPLSIDVRGLNIKAVDPTKEAVAMVVLEALQSIDGKTHEEVSMADIANGSHDVSMGAELSQFEKLKVLGKRLSADEAKQLGYKVISSRWVHTWKIKGMNRVPKSRLVIRGFLDREVVPVYVDIPTGKFRRMAMIVGLSTGKEAYVVDVKTAFLQAPIPLQRKIAVKLPKVFPRKSGKFAEPEGIYILEKAMYGLQDSPRVFCDWLKGKLLE